MITLFALIKRLFIRPSNEDPGQRLSEDDAPQIFALLREVAARVGTRAVDRVFITGDTTIAVFERGSLVRRLQHKTERCLVVGLGVLEGMTQAQLRSILAHEYGHFTNRDTGGGGLALHVRRSLLGSAEAMVQHGANAWYNPAWLFIDAFYRIYLRVSHGASRLQEVMADRWAAVSYGAASFVEGLRHVVRRSVEFDLVANREFQQAFSERRSVQNIYTLGMAALLPKNVADEGASEEAEAPDSLDGESAELSPAETLEQAYGAAINDPGSAYDSHPPINKRIAWVERLIDLPLHQDSGAPVWDLLPNATAMMAMQLEQIDESVKAAIAQERELDEDASDAN